MVGVDAEVVCLGDVVIQPLQMVAVQMLDVAAALAAQQETAGMLLVLMGAVLVHRAVRGSHLVDAARLFQLFQLAVDGGKAHGIAAAAQLLRQVVGGEGLCGALLQAVQHRLLLFGTICHRILLSVEYENENHFQL